MGTPLMVLSSTCGDVTPHSQSHVTFASRTPGRMDGSKESSNVSTNTLTSPTFPVRPLFGQGDPYSSLPAPPLSLIHPILSNPLGRNYFNAGAFRPLGFMDDRNGAFHGSAFMPAKCLKLDGLSSGSDLGTSQSLLLGSCFQNSGNETNFHQSPANSTGSSLGQGVGSFMDGRMTEGTVTQWPMVKTGCPKRRICPKNLDRLNDPLPKTRGRPNELARFISDKWSSGAENNSIQLVRLCLVNMEEHSCPSIVGLVGIWCRQTAE
ncbi:uncharacterized protein CEXT_516091 [Caerostris extrusa]|uniref:Uncharacterized protein n=1 Tax=Caerostris extrusa TaxID=172846 RepID=A0AAV4NKI0_CAEEX|nr:uncharacterized protein CEXT_516091 [Caerostris extrusa]